MHGEAHKRGNCFKCPIYILSPVLPLLLEEKKKKRASQTFFCLDSGLLISSEKFINSLVCSLPGLTRNS